MTKKDKILEVGIGKDARLYVRPESENFSFIYRAGCEVNWDESQNILWASKRGDWSYAQWFSQILGAVKTEYGIILQLDANVKWTNIPEKIQKEIADVVTRI